MPKISVIMPVYNGEKFLKDAIEGVLNQTYKDFEFLILDDGSTDNSSKIVESFSDPRIKVVKLNHKGIVEALNMALHYPHKYEIALSSVQTTIFAFGGSFLLMVFLDFFLEDHEIKWIKIVEDSRLVHRISGVANIELIIAIILGIILAHQTHDFGIVLAYMYGILLHSLLGMLDHFLSSDTVKSGIAGFIYLEVLDASFSFDGVIGAFALTSNMFVIMIGLGVGAMFVRSITLYFVEHKTLSAYRYLEHGAHYAIGVLALIMLLKITMHISEMLTGSIGIALISIALAHSIWENKKC